MTDRELINLAFSALENAYAPYSGFRVGAALECADGSVFLGCTVENASFGDTVCAERCAVVKAVSEGRREFRRIAVAAASGEYCLPCGSCLQVLREFSPDDMVILGVRGDGRYVSYKLSALLPRTSIKSAMDELTQDSE
ncbi:MAG: cytidine deaminase [Oscillospiraceae bacterium]|nr:cytidine deaminase [Oscillospiraceae bacterium]